MGGISKNAPALKLRDAKNPNKEDEVRESPLTKTS